ncbi:hypothetical protein [Kitasatospora brasiliensis]|uniref:hypothetical protein n=1 Tax=Kitasatospora brasiliensis TaxID=3058040 RepID=UPI00292D22FC|nr:hypothetical protein [Kitasatospora sp. K002]
MKKTLAGFVATGVLTLGALAGTAGSASADVGAPAGEAISASWLTNCDSARLGCFNYQGAFANASSCESYVSSIGAPAGWDCEWYASPWFSSHGAGWYATSIYWPKTP